MSASGQELAGLPYYLRLTWLRPAIYPPPDNTILEWGHAQKPGYFPVDRYNGQSIDLSWCMRYYDSFGGDMQIRTIVWQSFGSGGSPDVYLLGDWVTVKVSWGTFRQTVVIPSTFGKVQNSNNAYLGIGFQMRELRSILDVTNVRIRSSSVKGGSEQFDGSCLSTL